MPNSQVLANSKNNELKYCDCSAWITKLQWRRTTRRRGLAPCVFL